MEQRQASGRVLSGLLTRGVHTRHEVAVTCRGVPGVGHVATAVVRLARGELELRPGPSGSLPASRCPSGGTGPALPARAASSRSRVARDTVPGAGSPVTASAVR